MVLPEPELADDAEGLAATDGNIDTIDRLDVADGTAEQAAPDREPDLDVVALHHHRRGEVGLRRIALGLGREQMPGIGMLRVGEDILGVAGLDDLALRHHADALGHPPHDAEIVGDEQHRHAGLGLEITEELENLGLDGDVEGGGGLVGDEQVGLVGERHRDHHPLSLAAGELVGIGAEPALGVADADLLEQLEHADARRRVAHALVELQHLADLALDGVERVERRHRLLEDDADIIAADAPEILVAGGEEILALEHDRGRSGARRPDTAGASSPTAR